ncbi:unnamed protein product [Onchocerca flexuosa]|uniref:Transmembrane protein n=1 Tax=Onchocerca flexuosa TaxID=387005 RepID=A0A183I325_9BILA|nr:unnamed protein product [Onchocerca flexuosa]
MAEGKGDERETSSFENRFWMIFQSKPKLSLCAKEEKASLLGPWVVVCMSSLFVPLLACHKEIPKRGAYSVSMQVDNDCKPWLAVSMSKKHIPLDHVSFRLFHEKFFFFFLIFK